MSFQNCMLCIFVPLTSKYFSDSLRSMLKLKLKPFHRQTSLSDPLEVSCQKEWCDLQSLPIRCNRATKGPIFCAFRFTLKVELTLLGYIIFRGAGHVPYVFLIPKTHGPQKKRVFFSQQRCEKTSRRSCEIHQSLMDVH